MQVDPRKVCRSFNVWLEKHATLLSAWSSLIAIVGLPLLLLGGTAAYFQVRDYLRRPDIALEFGTPKEIRFWVVNISSVLIREPQYQLGLWDLDARAKGGGDDPGNLMIPVKTLEYIRPRSARGPWTIESLARSGSRIPDGHVVFGWAMVQCPDCLRRRNYWVYMKKGETAWYTEIPQTEELRIMSQISGVLRSGPNYEALIDEIVPKISRSPVQDAG